MANDSTLDQFVHLLERQRPELSVMSDVIPVRHVKPYASVREGDSNMLEEPAEGGNGPRESVFEIVYPSNASVALDREKGVER